MAFITQSRASRQLGISPGSAYRTESNSRLLLSLFPSIIESCKFRPKFIRLEAQTAEGQKAENEYEEGEAVSDQTHLLERIMGLRVELNHAGESSRQQQIRHDAELRRLRNSNTDLQTRVDILQAENNTLRVQLNSALSVISYLEQRLRFHLESLLEEVSPLDRINDAAAKVS